MVELDPKDYSEILNWLTLAYGKDPQLGENTLRTFWKLTFLAEDCLSERELHGEKEHSEK
jgi:hypothetical protein